MGGVLDSRFTFSRAGNATYINSSGYVALADANMLLQSESLATSPWSAQNGATATNVSITNPIGGATSTQITTGGTGSNSVGQTPTYGAAGAHTLSIWVRSGTATRISIGIYSGGFVTGTISVLSGSATVTGTDLFTVTNLTSTWTRLQIVYTTLSAGTVLIYPDTPSPTVPLTVYAWGAQLNQGSTAQTYYQTTTAAYYAPRFDYDPTTLAPKGLLIEGSATNLSTYSADFTNAAWTKQNSSITAAAITSPENALTGSLLAENVTTFGKHGIEKSVAITAGSIYTFSVFLKEPTTDSRRYVVVQVADGQAIAARFTANFDLQLGTVAVSASTNGTAGAPTDTNSSITAYPNGWYKCSVTMKHVASPSYPVVLLNNLATLPGGANQSTYAPSAPYKGIYVWGAQLELGNGASSYIPTVASQVTRATDSCTFAITPANIGLTSTPPATFVYSANVHAIPTSGYPTIIAFQDSGNTTAVFRSQINSTTSNYVTWLPTGTATNQANEITFSTLAQGVSFKVASSITSTFVTASRNSIAATPAAVGATYSFVTPDKIVIGILASNVAFTIANFKFFPSAKSQAELNALST